MTLALAPRADFSQVLRDIATEQLAGDDVESRIAGLARVMKRDVPSIRHDVDEMVDLLRD